MRGDLYQGQYSKTETGRAFELRLSASCNSATRAHWHVRTAVNTPWAWQKSHNALFTDRHMTASSQPHPVDWDLCMNTGGITPVGKVERHTVWDGHWPNSHWRTDVAKSRETWIKLDERGHCGCFGKPYYSYYGLVRAYATFNLA